MRSGIVSFCVATLLAFALGPGARAATIHLVIVADTLDAKIGRNVQVDRFAIEGVFRTNVPEATRILSVKVLEGAACHPDAIRRTIDSLNVGRDDAVVVTYHGHGAYDVQVGHYLSFPRLGNGYLRRADLIAQIRARGARLGVVMTDCCNKLSMLPKNVPPTTGTPGRPAPLPKPSLLFTALFLDVAGFVDITSSRPDEESISYPATRDQNGIEDYGGGLFSTALVNLFGSSSERIMTWDEVTRQTAETVAKAFRRLKPDGLDNPDAPEKPQMTQTVLASLSIQPIRRTDPGTDPAPPPYIPFDPDLLASSQTLGVLGFENNGRGIYVWATRANSPAARLGLEQGDIILSVNDNTIRTARGFQLSLLRSQGMALVVFQDVRTRQIRTATVALDDAGFRPDAYKPGPGDPPTFGANLDESPAGLSVKSTVPGSPAALLQLDPGDRITGVNGKPVRTNAEFSAAVAASPDEMWFELFNSKTGRPQGMVTTLDRRSGRPPGPGPAPGPARNLTLGAHVYENSGQGVLVYATRPGSPAAKLGFERNDLILAIDGQSIQTVAQYRNFLTGSSGQVEITFRDCRTGQVRQVQAQLETHPDPPAEPGNRLIFGAVVVEVPEGVRVRTIYANSAAHLAGVDVGDIIVSINGTPIRTLAEYQSAVRTSPDEMTFSVRNVRTGALLGMVAQLDR